MIVEEKIVVAAIAVLAAIITAGAAIWMNSRNARRLQKHPFLERQLELCMEASQVASVLATTSSMEAFDQAHSRFLELFWGPLSVVENDGVSSAMIRFRHKLDELVKRRAPLRQKALQHLSYELAKEVRQLILDAWEIRKLDPIVDTNKIAAGTGSAVTPATPPIAALWSIPPPL